MGKAEPKAGPTAFGAALRAGAAEAAITAMGAGAKPEAGRTATGGALEQANVRNDQVASCTRKAPSTGGE
jgi:hypothetical protein